MLAAGEARADRLQYVIAEALRLRHATDVNQLDRRSACRGAPAQMQMAEALAARIVVGLQRRGSRAEHDRHPPLPSIKYGKIARRIAQTFLLFERPILLFVDDDQTELR